MDYFTSVMVRCYLSGYGVFCQLSMGYFDWVRVLFSCMALGLGVVGGCWGLDCFAIGHLAMGYLAMGYSVRVIRAFLLFGFFPFWL